MSGIDMNEIFELLSSLANVDDDAKCDYKQYLCLSHRIWIDRLLTELRSDKILNEEESE